MILTHSGITYECATAVKCEDDNYIILYDESGVEIASFYDIEDFTEYSLSGGSFVSPCDCGKPISLATYSIGGRTITTNDWVQSGDNYTYTINNALISSNTATCNIFLFFATGTELDYTATQEAGKIVLSVSAAPLADIVIESIQITRA